jgi:hypothetical protein
MLGNKLRGDHTHSPQWLFDRTYWMAYLGLAGVMISYVPALWR